MHLLWPFYGQNSCDVFSLRLLYTNTHIAHCTGSIVDVHHDLMPQNKSVSVEVSVSLQCTASPKLLDITVKLQLSVANQLN